MRMTLAQAEAHIKQFNFSQTFNELQGGRSLHSLLMERTTAYDNSNMTWEEEVARDTRIYRDFCLEMVEQMGKGILINADFIELLDRQLMIAVTQSKQGKQFLQLAKFAISYLDGGDMLGILIKIIKYFEKR